MVTMLILRHLPSVVDTHRIQPFARDQIGSIPPLHEKVRIFTTIDTGKGEKGSRGDAIVSISRPDTHDAIAAAKLCVTNKERGLFAISPLVIIPEFLLFGDPLFGLSCIAELLQLVRTYRQNGFMEVNEVSVGPFTHAFYQELFLEAMHPEGWGAPWRILDPFPTLERFLPKQFDENDGWFRSTFDPKTCHGFTCNPKAFGKLLDIAKEDPIHELFYRLITWATLGHTDAIKSLNLSSPLEFLKFVFGLDPRVSCIQRLVRSGSFPITSTLTDTSFMVRWHGRIDDLHVEIS